MLRKNFPGNKDRKRAEGIARDAAFRAMTLVDRLSRNSVRYAERVAKRAK